MAHLLQFEGFPLVPTPEPKGAISVYPKKVE